MKVYETMLKKLINLGQMGGKRGRTTEAYILSTSQGVITKLTPKMV